MGILVESESNSWKLLDCKYFDKNSYHGYCIQDILTERSIVDIVCMREGGREGFSVKKHYMPAA